MIDFQPILDILKYGDKGFQAILLIVIYYLLVKEQAREKGRKEFLIIIYVLTAVMTISMIKSMFTPCVTVTTDNDSDVVELTMLKATTGNTTVGAAEASKREVSKIIQNQIRKKIIGNCKSFDGSYALTAEVSFEVHQSTDGQGNCYPYKFKFVSTNINNEAQSCIKNAIVGTIFPEPSDPPQMRVGENGEEYVDYWAEKYEVSVRIDINPREL